MLKGTLCELCPNRVEFGGVWKCTEAACNCVISPDHCDRYFYSQGEDCATCGRSSDCPYFSEKTPLAY